MKHPAETDLALYSSGDLGPFARWRLSTHLTRCTSCSRHVTTYQRTAEALKITALELPDSLNWNRLAAEMKANIRLGLDAGEVVALHEPRHRTLGWRTAIAFAALSAVIVSGWWFHMPKLHLQTPASGIVVAQKGIGLELKEGNGALILLHPQTGDVTFSADAVGVVQARFVDAESGQVTINNVYAE